MIQARKRFGQHFLHDPGVIERIATPSIRPPPTICWRSVLGRGALTQLLLAGPYASFDAIEIDRDLAAILRADRGAGTRRRVA